jgi:RHS repeat-associated protein
VKLSYGNNIVGQFGYNAQLQLSSIQYGAAAPAAPLLSLNYLYGDGLDNGQIQGITDNVVAERSTSYKYDPLGQLVMAQTTDLAKPNTWKLAFNYDQYGNRLNEIPQAGAGAMPGNSVTVSTSSNHISSSGVTYDNAGNTVADGVNYYTFDAENRLVATSPVVGLGGPAANFSYGPDGARVNNNGTYVIYAGGQPIAEYANGAASGSPTAEYINVNGNQVASIVGGALSFNFADHLSTRVSADLNGVPNRTYGHFPFGETWYQTGTSNKWDFTSYERDLNSSGLDYANARFYSSRLGRFISLDQVLGSNRFAYVGNDPVNLVDPTGMDAACTNDPFTHSPMPLCGPDQAGSAVGSNCGANFGNDGFSINFTSNCSSFSINLGNFGGVPFGDLGQTIHNTLATFFNIDTCPEGEFECPEGGRPLFGTPSCGPFCVMDVTSAQPSLKDECLNRFYNSGMGKLVDFGSVGGLIPGWSPNASKNLKEIATLGTLKYGGLKGVEKFATANDIVVIRTLNTVRLIPSSAGAGLNVGLHFLGKATGFLSLAATAFDLVTHFGCAIETGPASPEDYSGLSD